MPITTDKVTILKRSVNTVLLLCAVVGTMVFASTPAYAIMSQPDIVTTKVDIRDLKTNYGVKRVYAQLAKKADASCGVKVERNIAARIAAQKCAMTLLASFVEDLDHKALTAHYNRMTQKP